MIITPVLINLGRFSINISKALSMEIAMAEDTDNAISLRDLISAGLQQRYPSIEPGRISQITEEIVTHNISSSIVENPTQIVELN